MLKQNIPARGITNNGYAGVCADGTKAIWNTVSLPTLTLVQLPLPVAHSLPLDSYYSADADPSRTVPAALALQEHNSNHPTRPDPTRPARATRPGAPPASSSTPRAAPLPRARGSLRLPAAHHHLDVLALLLLLRGAAALQAEGGHGAPGRERAEDDRRGTGRAAWARLRLKLRLGPNPTPASARRRHHHLRTARRRRPTNQRALAGHHGTYFQISGDDTKARRKRPILP